MEIVLLACTKCLKEKRRVDFPDGKKWCRDCCNDYSKAHYRKNREQRRAEARDYYREHKNHVQAKTKAWVAKNKRRVRDLGLRRRYGITIDQYETLLKEQNGVCAICKQPPKAKFALAVDHCHATGRIRGLLCSDCNTTLGLMRDSTDLLARAIDYLTTH